jgi:hypothetical protein
LTAAAGRSAPTPGPLPPWAKPGPDGLTVVLTLHIQPGASKSGPAGRHSHALKLRISAPPADNKANDALIEFLRGAFDLPRSRVRIAYGAHSRQKVVEVDAPPAALAAQLCAWDAGTQS